MVEIVDGQVLTRKRPEQVCIYFLQAVTLGLIKIGMAEKPEVRVRGIALVSPDKIEVLGIKVCHDSGALESELHARFAEYRVRGEWFSPAKPILDYINVYAVTTGKVVDRLNGVAAFPTMPHGRPTKEMMAQRALAGLGKWQ